MKKSYTPNDQRSQVKDPNQAAYGADRANRIEHGHANVPPPPPATPAPAEPSTKQ